MASVFSGVGSPASEAAAAASAVASLGAPKDLKEKGNAAMAAGDSPEAVRLWSNAVHALSHSSSLQSSTSSADADLLTSLLSNLSLGLLKLTNPLFPVDALTASLYHAEAALLVSPLHKNARLRRARCFALCGMEGAARLVAGGEIDMAAVMKGVEMGTPLAVPVMSWATPQTTQPSPPPPCFEHTLSLVNGEVILLGGRSHEQRPKADVGTGPLRQVGVQVFVF